MEALTAFDFEFLHPILVDGTAQEGPTPGTTLKILGAKGAMKPSLAEGRGAASVPELVQTAAAADAFLVVVGMGVHQFAPGGGVQVKVTRRTTKSD